MHIILITDGLTLGMVQVEQGGMTVLEAQNKPAAQRSILDLPQLVESELSYEQKVVFHRIFEVDYDEAPLDYPAEQARLKITKDFGQEIVMRQGLDVINHVLDEEALINPVRANRPLQSVNNGITNTQIEDLEKANPQEECSFCHPDVSSPRDPFGSVQGEFSKSIANAGSYGPWNTLVVPTDVHSPLKFWEEEKYFVDMIHTGARVCEKAERYNPKLTHRLMGYNQFPRGGGSVFHPHLGVLLRNRPLQKVEDLRNRMEKYEDKWGFPYLDELAYCLRPLGLVHDIDSAHIVFNPVPKKEKEVVIYTNDGNRLPNGDLSRAAFRVVEWWVKKLGVTSFNMVIYMPPSEVDIKEWGPWHNFFPFMRIVERGDESRRTSDIGFMELYAASVVSSDPFKLAQSFAEYLKEKVAA